MFAIRGKFRGKDEQFVLAWNDGVLSGDERAVFLAEMEAEFSNGEAGCSEFFRVGKQEILSTEGCCLHMLQRMFDEVELIAGEMPEQSPLPEGAIP